MTQRQCYLAAAGTTVVVFLLYLATLSPSVALWDAGEYIAAASSLGIPHQPSNPMFVLIAHVAGLLPLSDSYAVRINLLAALSSAVVAGLWFLCAERVLRSMVEDPWRRMATAVASALLGATAFTVWNQSVVMEKVYPLALVGLALVSWLMLVWFDASERRADRLLVLVAYLVGVGYAIHPAGLLTAPAAALAVAIHRPKTLLRWRLLAVLVGAFVFGATPFAVLPIRAAYQPFVNESAVSACEDGRLAWSCTFSKETAKRLVGTIQREQYGGNPVLVRRAPFAAQVQQYAMYFKWQWMRDVYGQSDVLQSFVSALMFVLGLFGLAALRRPRSANAATRSTAPPYLSYFATLAASFTIALIIYLNFRYSSGQNPELGNLVEREPRERDYFYMWTFSLWGLLAGVGLASFVFRFGSATRQVPLRIAALATVALFPLAANFESASRAGQSFTREWAIDMLNSVEPNAVLITNGDNDSFPLWYAQEVEGIRRDVTVTLTPYLGMDWYARQMNRRSKLWQLSDQELDTIPPYVQSQTPWRFTHGAIDAMIPAGFLTRDQLLVLRAIKDSFPNRPIYFSFGAYPQQLGLGEHIKRVGLAQKLEPLPVREGPDTARTPNGFLDVERSLALWRKYGGARQVVREGQWVDEPSNSVPLYYAFVGQELAIALEERGRHAEAQEVIELARLVAVAAQR
jgi:hypothetical protein